MTLLKEGSRSASRQRADEFVADYLRSVLPEMRREQTERIRRTDGVVMWIVGLATAGVAFIVSQGGALTGVGRGALRWSIGLFASSIVAGTLFRFNHWRWESKASSALWRINHQLAVRTADIWDKSLPDDADRDEIRRRLRSDFGLDENQSLAGHSEEELRSLYERKAEQRSQHEKEGIRSMLGSLSTLSYTKEYTDPFDEEGDDTENESEDSDFAKSRFKQRLLSAFLYLTTATAFVTGVLVIAVAYLL